MPYLRNAVEYLENTSLLYPDKPAFCDEHTSITFGELNKISRYYGEVIYKALGHTRDRIVVMTDRSIYPIIGFMSALYAGSCYVPVDSKMPSDRMAEIIAQINPGAILYFSSVEKSVISFADEYRLIRIDTSVEEDPDLKHGARIISEVLDIDPAYMIFTSGSTGKPKGILISHRSLIDFTEWLTYKANITADDVLANQAPFYFDLSVKDIYQVLKNGCTAYILPKKLFMFPTLLIESLNKYKVTTLFWATSAFRITAESGVLDVKQPEFLKNVILGGEALLAKHLNIWKKHLTDIKYINLYGPTEVTVDCTYYIVDRNFSDSDAIPIGYPCENKEIILLDDSLTPVRDGEAGEICVRGIGLSLGYFGDEDKTNHSFINNPLNPYYPDKLYRTGDIAKKASDGMLYFLSRKDNQIKHMGYRIELGEIEVALSAISELEGVVCFFDEQNDEIVCAVKTKLDIPNIIQLIKNRIPKYMLPNKWLILDSLPVNRNGKIDRRLIREQYFKGNIHI